MPQFNAPVYGMGDVANYTRMALATQQYLDEQKASAIRWQGAQDFDTLIKSGIAPNDALRRSAAKMFYNDPRALAATMPAMTSQVGGLFQEPTTGRWFTIDRWGTPRAVPSQYTGNVSFMGPNNTMWKLPLEPGGNVPASAIQPEVKTGTIVNVQGVGPVTYGTRGEVRQLSYDPTELIKRKDPNTGVEYTMTRGESAKADAMKEAQPLIDEYKANLVQIQSGEKMNRPGVFFGSYYTNLNKGIIEKLRQIGVDTNGNVIPGTDLAREVYGGAVKPSPYQMAPAVPPQGSATQPPWGAQMSPPVNWTQTPPAQGPGLTPQNWLYGGGAPAAPAAPAVTAPAAPTVTAPRPPGRTMYYRQPRAQTPTGYQERPLAPNEVIRQMKLPDGRTVLVIFDKNTKQYLRNAY